MKEITKLYVTKSDEILIVSSYANPDRPEKTYHPPAVLTVHSGAYTFLKRFFSDKNECLDKSAKCNVNAACTNTLGSYRCRCKNGYTGDGETCQGNLLRLSCDIIFEYDIYRIIGSMWTWVSPGFKRIYIDIACINLRSNLCMIKEFASPFKC